MSQFEEAFMAGFNGELNAEKTAEAAEMPILDKALGNLGLLEEEVDMPVLKQAMENLGLLEEEGEIDMPVLKQAMENLGLLEEESEEEVIEASSMLEALAIQYGDDVLAEREKTAALEKEAAGMVREKAKSVFKKLWGESPAGSRPYKSSEMVQELRGKGPGRVSKGKAAKVLGRRAAVVGGGALVAGGTAKGVAALLKKKKDKKEKKGKK